MDANSLIPTDILLSVVDNMDNMFRVLDPDHNIVYMNKKMRQLFGDFQDKKCYELLLKNKRCDNCISEKCFSAKDKHSKSINLFEHYYQVKASAIPLDDGKRYFVEVFQDITSEKTLNNKLLDQYRKMREDSEFAGHIQQSILPQNPSYGCHLSLTSLYLPSEELGGDIFDVFEIDNKTSVFYISDVSGHGIKSSVLTMFIHQLIRGLKANAANIPLAIEEIINNYKNIQPIENQYFSLLYFVFNSAKMELEIVNAGHNCPPILIKNNGEIVELSYNGLPICELLSTFSHEIYTLKVSPGDRLLLYTDGVTECLSPDKDSLHGVAVLLKILEDKKNNPNNIILDDIVGDICTRNDETLQDDIAMAFFTFH